MIDRITDAQITSESPAFAKPLLSAVSRPIVKMKVQWFGMIFIIKQKIKQTNTIKDGISVGIVKNQKAL